MRINYQKLINYYEKTVDTDKFLNVLIKLGFDKISVGNFSDVFRFKDSNFVIKVCIRGNQGLPVPDNRSKRLKELFVGYKCISLDSKVGVQERVEEYASIKDKVLRKNLLKLTKLKYDIHIGNIGYLNNRPVVFDF